MKFPMDVISALLGIPEEYRETYRHQLDEGLKRDPDTGSMPRRSRRSAYAAVAYIVLS